MTEPDCQRGRTLLRFAERVFDPETVERVLLPAFADLQHECESGTTNTRSRPFVRVRAYWGIWKTLAVCLAGDALRDRDGFSASLTIRTLLFLLLLVALMGLLSGRWLLSFGATYGEWAAVRAGVLLLPSTLASTLPVALFLAVGLFRTTGAARLPALIPATTAATLACAFALFIGAMFVVPSANQSFRTLVFNTMQPPDPGLPPREIRKGLAEMSWMELKAHIREAPSSRQEEIARSHRLQRFAMIASTFVMALLGLGVAGRWQSRATTIAAALALLVLYVGCFTLASGQHPGGYPSAYGTWAANAAFALVGMRLLRTRQDWKEEINTPAL